MPTLLDLPAEVLEVIISDTQCIRDIAALAVQCRRLHGICNMATRKRYHRISLHRGSNLQTATKLLLSILRNPILGTYVRDLKFCTNISEADEYYSEENDWLEEATFEEDSARVYSATRKAGFSGSEERRVAEFALLEHAEKLPILPGGYGGKFGLSFEDRPVVLKLQALAALFISVSPNLESLALSPLVDPARGVASMRLVLLVTNGCRTVPTSPLIESLDRINSKIVKTGALQNVRHITFVLEQRDFCYVHRRFALLENLNLVHQLPNLESIRVGTMSENRSGVFGMEDANAGLFSTPSPNSSDISKIHFESSYVRTRYLELIIGICKRLTEFTFWTRPRLGINHSNPRGLGVIAPKTLGRALLSQRHSLEALDLEIDDTIADFDTEEPSLLYELSLLADTGRILVHFTSLTRLTINLRLLLYFAMDDKPVSEGGKIDNDSPGEGSRNSCQDSAGHRSQQDNEAASGGDLEVRHRRELKDKKDQILIEFLPPKLEYLCILRYYAGFNRKHDFLLSGLMMDFREGRLLPQLKEVRGVDEVFVRSPDTGKVVPYSENSAESKLMDNYRLSLP